MSVPAATSGQTGGPTPHLLPERSTTPHRISCSRTQGHGDTQRITEVRREPARRRPLGCLPRVLWVLTVSLRGPSPGGNRRSGASPGWERCAIPIPTFPPPSPHSLYESLPPVGLCGHIRVSPSQSGPGYAQSSVRKRQSLSARKPATHQPEQCLRESAKQDSSGWVSVCIHCLPCMRVALGWAFTGFIPLP